jgi:hypothetical protein
VKTPDELFAYLFECYPTLFQTRLNVLGHLFVTNGCGYVWEDGALVDVRGGRETRDARDAHLPTGPVPDDGTPENFYPMCECANLANIPDDVQPEWLALAYETAVALRDRSGGEWGRQNRQWGRRLIRDIVRRFPHVERRSK